MKVISVKLILLAAVFYSGISHCSEAGIPTIKPACSKFHQAYIGSYGSKDVELLRECALSEDLSSIIRLAKLDYMYHEKEYSRNGIKLYHMAEAMGDVSGLSVLAEYYYEQLAEDKAYLSKAVEFSKKAFESSHDDGSLIYAKLLLFGDGVNQDIKLAMKIIKDLSESGSYKAIDLLNIIHKKQFGESYKKIEKPRIFEKKSDPIYPRKAAWKSLGGYVITSFYLDEDGFPQDVRVLESYPKKMFVKSALKATRRTQYVEKGLPGDKERRMYAHTFMISK